MVRGLPLAMSLQFKEGEDVKQTLNLLDVCLEERAFPPPGNTHPSFIRAAGLGAAASCSAQQESALRAYLPH